MPRTMVHDERFSQPHCRLFSNATLTLTIDEFIRDNISAVLALYEYGFSQHSFCLEEHIVFSVQTHEGGILITLISLMETGAG